MTNQSVNVPDFSPEGYVSIIEAARSAGYKLIRVKDGAPGRGPRMILRHDVDFSVSCALDMARLEHKIGVCSTYFFMVTCDYYNIFNVSSRAALREIAGMGHEIGLHWDSTFLPERKETHADFFYAQRLLLGNCIGAEIVSASQHIPTETPIFDISLHIPFDAYSLDFRQRFPYVSDSAMVWREKTPLDLISEGTDIQFLAHPIWWMTAGPTQEEKIGKVIAAAQADISACSFKFIAAMRAHLTKRAFYDERLAKAMESHGA